MTAENIFFESLLNETKEAFHRSPIFERQEKEGKKWSYSVCGTPIQIGKGIIFGINWGVDGEHQPQTKMQDGSDIDTYKFVERSRWYLKEYFLLDINDISFNYTNLCFFRSPGSKDLTDLDYKLSLPLFERYVKFIDPEWILSLGSGSSQILLNNGLLKGDNLFKEGKAKFKASAEKLWGYDFYAVPHPNARVKNDLRKELWAWIGQERLKNKLHED